MIHQPFHGYKKSDLTKLQKYLINAVKDWDIHRVAAALPALFNTFDERGMYWTSDEDTVFINCPDKLTWDEILRGLDEQGE